MALSAPPLPSTASSHVPAHSFHQVDQVDLKFRIMGQLLEGTHDPELLLTQGPRIDLGLEVSEKVADGCFEGAADLDEPFQ